MDTVRTGISNGVSAAARTPLRGVIAAIATPITARFSPDAARFVALARGLLEGGCDGLNILGTTGEATSFTVEQRMALMTAAANGGLPVHRLMAGTGAAALDDAVRLSRHAAEVGLAGALVLPPFYYKNIPDAGVIAYLGAIVEATAANEIPIYLYNYPALSGVPYTVPLISRLLKEFGTRIAGLKDSSGDHAYARAVAALSPALAVFPSTEAVLMEARDGPFAGCISATANLNAAYCAKAFRNGDANALKTAVAIRKLFDGLPLVPGIKTLLAHIHRDPTLASVMPPLAPYAVAETATLRARYDTLAI